MFSSFHPSVWEKRKYYSGRCWVFLNSSTATISESEKTRGDCVGKIKEKIKNVFHFSPCKKIDNNFQVDVRSNKLFLLYDFWIG